MTRAHGVSTKAQSTALELNFDFCSDAAYVKRIAKQDKECFGDIVSSYKQLLIELNGDYWHCNPEKYESDFFHHVKIYMQPRYGQMMKKTRNNCFSRI